MDITGQKETQTFLREINLFRSLDDHGLNSLAKKVGILNLESGEILLKENEIANSMFLVLDGAIEIYSHSEKGNEVSLAVLKKGQHFGEQALISGARGERNANARTIKKSILVKISKESFNQVLEEDPDIHNYINKIGKEQLRQKLEATSSAFRSLSIPEAFSQWIDEKNYLDGEQVFREGEIGDNFYLIVSGKAVAIKNENGKEKILTKYGQGSFFGELALIRNEARSATVKADGPLRLISLGGEHFIRLYKENTSLKNQFKHLETLYNVKGTGVLSVHNGEYLGMNAITTVLHGLDGNDVATTRVKEKPITIMTRVQVATDEVKIHEEKYEDIELGVSRSLQISNGEIISANIYGNWDQMGNVFQNMVQVKKIYAWNLALFRQEGSLFLDQGQLLGDESIVCDCNQVTLGTLKKAIQDGCDNFESLTVKTGACMVCGACRPKITKTLGYSNMEQAEKIKEYQVTSEVKTFQFKPKIGPVFPSKPGQNISIEAMIGGDWVQRVYTLTSPAGQTDHYEISVKKEEKGIFSNWIHENFQRDSIIRVAKPHGKFYLGEKETNPTICICAGIGMTPFLAMIRTFAKDNDPRELHLIYSARSKNLFAYKDELKEYVEKFPNISVDFHETSKKGRLSQESINHLVGRYPSSVFFMCGPAAFQESTKRMLIKSGVLENQIQIESFEVIKKGENKPPMKASKILNLGSMLTFVLAISFFLVPSWDADRNSIFRALNNQIISGYSIFGLVIFGMILSIPKRTKFLRFIKFDYIRAFHILLGLVSLTILVFHTGMNLGVNLNFLLMVDFLLVLIIGSMAGKLVVLENKNQSYFRLREVFKIMHWSLSWPLPVLIGLHIFSVYYY
jgi:ferredoxin-NADP reductase/CRP-like cAMP-binding protein